MIAQYDKLRELVIYICQKGADDQKLGRTKLNKLLYFCDFGFYVDNGRSITSSDYMRIEQGPVPRRMKPLLDSMLESGELIERSVPAGPKLHVQKPIATRPANMDAFTSEEISFVDEILKIFEHMTGTQLSNLTHSEIGWRATKDHQAIPYATFYMPVYAEHTDGDVQRSRQLSEQFGWTEKYAA